MYGTAFISLLLAGDTMGISNKAKLAKLEGERRPPLIL